MSGGDPVAEALAAVQRRIEEACDRSGRDADEVTLVGVSKLQPVDKMRAAVAAGLRVFGETRVQEALSKSAELEVNLDWHLIGPLQSNKVKPASRLFSTIHSVDRLKIARLLDKDAGRLGRPIAGFLEVNLGAEPSKHGFLAAGIAEEVRPLADFESLRIVGLMAIPPYEEDPEQARAWFRRLRELRDELRSRPEWDGRLPWLSMGMSHDFEIAVEEGATHVRVGTALFGERQAD
jgi:PLP dependent protein